MDMEHKGSAFLPDDGMTKEIVLEADEAADAPEIKIKYRPLTPTQIEDYMSGILTPRGMIVECIEWWNAKAWNEKRNKLVRIPCTEQNLRYMKSGKQYRKLSNAILEKLYETIQDTPDEEDEDEEIEREDLEAKNSVEG